MWLFNINEGKWAVYPPPSALCLPGPCCERSCPARKSEEAAACSEGRLSPTQTRYFYRQKFPPNSIAHRDGVGGEGHGRLHARGQRVLQPAKDKQALTVILARHMRPCAGTENRPIEGISAWTSTAKARKQALPRRWDCFKKTAAQWNTRAKENADICTSHFQQQRLPRLNPRSAWPLGGR